MPADLRRNLPAIAAEAARAEGAAERTSFAVAAGSMILGAALSRAAHAAEHRPTADAADRESAIVPESPEHGGWPADTPQASAAPATGAEHLSLPEATSVTASGAGAPEFAASPGGTEPAARADSPAISEPAAEFGHGADGSDGVAAPFGGSPPLDVASPPSTASGPASILDGLAGDLGPTLNSLLSSTFDMSGLLQQTVMNLDRAVTGLIDTIEQAAAAVAQPLAQTPGATLDALAHGIGAALAPDAATADPPNPHADAASADATLLDGSPAALPDAAAPAAGDAPSPGFDAQSSQGAGPADLGAIYGDLAASVAVGFMGQSYVDAFDSHDVAQQAFHSPLHGLV